MKAMYLMFFIASLFITETKTTDISIQPNIEQSKVEEAENTLPWHLIAAGSGLVGLIITFVPYLSLTGVLLCGFAIVAGIIGRRKKLNKRLSNLGILLGSLGLVVLLGVIGLVLFF